ncbi:MAG: glycosyltransferase family 39 protein, partial [Candidatus Pacearchaeota archaeon]|nr:glycosyltransferase family 39 protein [Candidatus Pacearchaeota archaeon]
MRPILFTFVFSLLYRIGFSEFTFRIIIFLISLASILLIYLIGKEMYNKRVGLIASFILAVFWSFTFFSFRILVDVPVAFFWLLTLYFFIRHYGKNDKKLWIFAIFLALGFMTKFTVALLGFVILIYALGRDRLKVFRNKNLWVAFGVLIVSIIPLLIFEYTKFGNPLAFFVKVATNQETATRTFFQSLYD